MPDAIPTWPELLLLMEFGEPEEKPFIGILHTYAGPGSGHSADSDLRVYKRGHEHRIEHAESRRPIAIAANHRILFFEDGEEHPSVFDTGQYAVYVDKFNGMVARHDLERWRGDDFTRPIGRPEAVTFLGRKAWRIELAPPAHKSSPLELLVDAENGMYLSQRSVQFWPIVEWTDLEWDVELPDALFEWNGPITEPEEVVWPSQEWSDEWFQERKKRKVSLPMTARLRLVDVWGDGGYSARLDFPEGNAGRRPTSAEAWDLSEYDLVEEWTDGVWDWFVAFRQGGSEESLRAFREQVEDFDDK